MISIEQIVYFIPKITLSVSITYYALTIRNQNKTRRLQIIQNMWEWKSTEQGYLNMTELMEMHWKDYEDFSDKYGVKNNPKNYALRWSIWNKMHVRAFA